MQKVVAGVLSSYEVYGEKNEVNLVVAHGWGGSGLEWRRLALELAERYRVIVLDFPGFGGSQKPKEVWGIYEYADWTKELLDKLEIDKCVFLGHSFGGRVGIILAARDQRLVTRLVLVDAAGIQRKSLAFGFWQLAKPFVSWLPQGIKNIFGSEDYKAAGEMRKIFVKVVNEDLRKWFSKILCPVTIVWGENDKVLPIKQGKQMSEEIKNSKFRVVWGGDHWPHIKKFDDFMLVLREEGIMLS